MAIIPYAPEVGAVYIIFGPDGTTASFNDSTRGDYVGMLTDVTGLDSPDVRDAGDVLAGADGGYDGYNYYGRRPITFAGTIFGHSTIDQRDARMSLLRRATNAMTADGSIFFQNSASGAPQMYLPFRRQQPTRFTGGWAKDFQALLVSRSAPILSWNQHTSTVVGSANPTVITIENQGDAITQPVFSLTAHGNTSGAVVITNTTTGLGVVFSSAFVLANTHGLLVDSSQHTALEDGTFWMNQYINYAASGWLGMVPGNNVFSINQNVTVTATWRDAWA